jgi:hypothetical protein
MSPLLWLLGVLAVLLLVDWSIKFSRPLSEAQRLNRVCVRFNRRYKHALAEYNGYLYQLVGRDKSGQGGRLVIRFRSQQDLSEAIASGKFPAEFDEGYKVEMKVEE